ncbi:MAG TPA: glycoside hydrolase family 3 C-terminal domain-containing protein [Solirubrobacteraceae bacterium]|jgi:beta-glucosidase|nr:glycoside hydrolase family 3 C-terminal domain-containing protein [Solirubrobacteraceae bacterium]
MPGRRAISIIFRRLLTTRLLLALAAAGAITAIAGPLANTATGARTAVVQKAAPKQPAATGSPAADSSGPTLTSGRSAKTSSPHTATKDTASCPWLDTSLTVGKRVNMLLAAMSLTDKIAEMYINEPTTTGPYAGYEGYVPAQPALCIPALVEEDGSLGVAYGATGVTQLPSEVSLASAWDPTLSYQYGEVNGAEHRAKGIAVVLGPGINIDRDPRWGRNFEMFSEDPLLTSVLGTANIEGIQSQGVMADPKHFVTYNQETYRATPYDNTIVNARALHEIYLPPFYGAIVKAHAASVMCAYPLLNGTYSCQNASLLTGLLDDKWGFTGFVRTDSDANASTVNSANAGLDQERGSFFWDNGQLANAVTAGQVRTATINAALRRILGEMFTFNMFSNPLTGNLSSPAATPADNAMAQNVAERGAVLLQNTGNVLPLTAATTSIAVIGPDGTTTPQSAGGGSSFVTPASVISPQAGITARAGAGVAVSGYSGTDPTAAAAAAAAAQVAIVFASYPEGEGSDLTSISLPNNQDAMIEAVAAANPNTIVVLNTGGPVLMPWLSSVKSVIEDWYPGQDDGSAIAAVLYGDIDPSGHLPETFPTSLAATPTASPSQFPGVAGKVDYSEGLDVGYRWYDAKNVTPLFPFGYGLSYTSFGFSDLKVITPQPVTNKTSGPDASAGQGARVARVSAVITNTGAVRGSDVVQLYIGDPQVAGEPPRQLEGFKRVTLKPGVSQTVTFAITGHELSYFNTTANGWTLPNGRFSLYVGDSSALTSLPLRGKLKVTKTIGNRYVRLTVPTSVNPGTTFLAKARFVNDGNMPITNGVVKFGFPSAWTVVRQAKTRILSLPAGHSATRYFRVTAPEQAEGEVKSLTAALTSKGADGAGDLSATSTISVLGPITAKAGPAVVVAPGTSANATVSVTSHMKKAVVVNLKPALPAGVTVSPALPTIKVPANRTVTLTVAVTVAAGTAPASDNMPLRPSFTYLGKTYPLASSGLTVQIPYASLAAAFDSSAISDDANIGAANFDGDGNSYSAEALDTAGLTSGSTVTIGQTELQWPDVAAGTADSVLTDGQTIQIAGTAGDTQLAFLGASSGNDESGTGTIYYTDGTMQTYSLALDDWFNNPDSAADNTVATANYINDSTGSGNNGVVGQRNHKARVFSVSIALTPGKTVSSVTLPMVATLPGVFPMHIFALGVGGAPAAS